MLDTPTFCLLIVILFLLGLSSARAFVKKPRANIIKILVFFIAIVIQSIDNILYGCVYYHTLDFFYCILNRKYILYIIACLYKNGYCIYKFVFYLYENDINSVSIFMKMDINNYYYLLYI